MNRYMPLDLLFKNLKKSLVRVATNEKSTLHKDI